MKSFSRLLICVFLVALVIKSAAQTQQLKFNLITGTNGISLGKINCVIQDKYGFIWLSDQSNRCIIRYDGNHMTKYQNDPKNANSLGGYYPECLAVDSAGNIWIGFYGMGLDKFDPVSNTFTHYRHNKNDAASLSDDFVAAVRIDHLGNIWVGSYGGLDLLDEKTGTFKHYKNIPGDTTSLSYNTIRNIYEDKAGELWIGTGLPWDNNNEGGLNHFNRKTGTFTRYVSDPKNPNSLINNKVRSIFEDSQGTFWIGTAGDGLHTMDRKTGLFTRLSYNPAKPEQLSRSPVRGVDDHITFITEDAMKQIWIGTMLNGIIRYDPVTKKITHLGNDTDKTGEFKETSSWWAYTTTDGLIWLTTQTARLYKIDLFNNLIPHFNKSTDNDGVHTVFRETESVTWFGTANGLIRKDISNGAITRYVNEPGNTNSLSNSIVEIIINDKRGNFWIGTDDGLNEFNPRSKKFTRYLYGGENNPDPGGKAVVCILEDRDSNIWAGTDNNGLYILDRKTGKFTNYRYRLNDTSTINGDDVMSLLEDETGDLWIGLAANAGLNKLNRKTGKFSLYLRGLIAGSLYSDADGIIWLGVPEGGLFRYDRELDNFYSFNEQNTGIDIHYIRSIIGDNENNLWMTTNNRGIYQLNKKRDHTVLYGKENGLNPENWFFYNSSYKAKNGELYFGDINGYYSFDPGKLKTVNSLSNLYFTNFWLSDKLINPGKDGPLKETLFTIKDIRLSHNQNVFSVSFNSVDFRNTGDNIVYYILENYDKDWRAAGNDNKVQYFKVPPGKYTLRIKTANSTSGKWLEKSIDIIISPPWWTTWWAYAIYALTLISFVFFIHRYQKERLIKAERERTRTKELAQAKEIEKAYHELRNTQAQLIQSEKMASLGELTAGIAHEIQNPLNFVNNFSEVNKELIEELRSEKSKVKSERDEKLEDELLSDISQNLEKINHHGKRADAIVKGMLQHSRSSTGQKEPTDINALADEYLRLAYHGLRAKDNSFNATIKTDFDKSIGNIDIIPQDIGRVILNLLTNAFYAASLPSKGGFSDSDKNDNPIVWVSTKKVGNQVLISVRDNGPGIPQKILDKIFQPFFTTKPTGQGTGLGLSLSYDIVKAHGGELKVETKEGEGSVFIIQLPNHSA
jgi:signal transduction histidine kinase/ligand-binding sensor domain-containing protein